jgi:ATP-binding cassette subfamily C protein CydD
VNRRLLAFGPVRHYAMALAGSALVAAVLVVVQASALAALVTGAVDGRFDRGALTVALTAIGLRVLHGGLAGALSARAAAGVKARLRDEVLEAATRRGPGWLAGQRAGELATLVGRGIDGLDGFLTGYLPQVGLAVAVPAAVLLRLAFADPASALTVAVTLPLIPVFGALIGWQTAARTKRQWRALSRLGGHFLDMVTGLSTLRAYGRERAQVATVRAMAEQYRAATVRTLRLAFLSALVLELVATISVALVAVPVGLSLLGGGLTLSTALLVLLLAPEAYLPLRMLGTKFHASQEGLAAANDAFAVIDEAPVRRRQFVVPEGAPPDVRVTPRVPPFESLVFDRVDVRYGDTVALRDASLRIDRGNRVALVGPSGGGKSTLLHLVLGFVAPTSGRVLVSGVDLATLDLAAWRAQLAWVPQRAHLFSASVADNIRLGASSGPVSAKPHRTGPGVVPDATLDEVVEAARAADADGFISALPDGYATRLGPPPGYDLSSGQRQRLALARAWLRVGAPLLLLDEPTARLDPVSEAAVAAAASRLAAGRTALIVAHRPALLDSVDRTVEVAAGRLVERRRLIDGRPIGRRAVGPRVIR